MERTLHKLIGRMRNDLLTSNKETNKASTALCWHPQSLREEEEW